MFDETNITLTTTNYHPVMGVYKGLRVLGRVRLSRSTEESTSVERQTDVIEQWASANGHRIVGWAEDLDVSGAVDPFETPGLGPWLGPRAGEWDVLCAWKLDRLGRNAIQLSKLFGWCQDHGKTVVSCSESIDLGSWAGRMLASVIAGLAEGELEAIRERQRSSRSKLRQVGRWAGGKPPFGYRAVRTGDGWGLEIDPDAYEVVRRIVDEVLDGKPLTRLARELTAEGVPTPAVYYAASKGSQRPGKTRSEGRWAHNVLKNMLRSKALRGYAHHRGETVRDEDGMPVQIAEPLVTLDEWDLIQAALDKTLESRRDVRRAESGPLTGLVYCLATRHKPDCPGVGSCDCPACDRRLHHGRNRVKRETKVYEYRYYRCQDRCSALIPAEDLEELAEEAFLYELGRAEVRERVWVPGDSREAELREAVTALDELTSAAGRARSATAKQRLRRQLDALDARIAELEAAPVREARWEYRGVCSSSCPRSCSGQGPGHTGQTYGSVWRSADAEARRELLQGSGITFAAVIDAGGERRTRSNPGVFRVDVRVPDGLVENLNRKRRR